ncbi:MAG: radical SAM protein [Candidatus Aminicenantes bacterium]|jgi:radical SAM superfamily enzyme YgiQ (UPF0313 family)
MSKNIGTPTGGSDTEKILLVLLPFWTSLIPPMGISCLKVYLQQHGYPVKTVDANIQNEFKEIYDYYLETLKKFIPEDKRGNFYNIAQDVLYKQMMARFNHEDEKKYIQLVKLLVGKTFFCQIHEPQVNQLDKLVAAFYKRLEEYFIHLLEQEKPTVLGLSVYSATVPASLFAFKLTKKRYPHIKTLMGGGIFAGDLDTRSPAFEFFLAKTPYIDKIIVGEGEKLLLKYLQKELPQSQRVYTLTDIDGQTLDLGKAVPPDFSDFELRYYPNMADYTSRGCHYNCRFCAEKVLWGRYRSKDPDQVVEELIKLYHLYGRQLFLMSDSLLNPVISALANALLESHISIYWDGYLRANKEVCDPENTLLWRRGGFYRARLGVESGSAQVLEAMGKKIMPDQMKTAVASLAHAGIKTTTYWVIGYPGETEKDFQQTLEMLEELKDDIYEADCNPFNYFLTGQVNSDQWAKENRSVLLYPESTRDMLVFPTWVLEGEPSRKEMFQRLNRFVRYCRHLGIPNPYTLNEIYQADERWKKLHKNAVPSLVEFEEGGNYIDENKKIKKIVFGKKIKADEGDWGF